MLNDLIAGLNSPIVPAAATENPIVQATQKPKSRSTEERLLDIIETLLEMDKEEDEAEGSKAEAPDPGFNSVMLNSLD